MKRISNIVMNKSRSSRRRGAMLVLVAVTIVLLIIAVAFSVDVAYMQLTRTELRTSTDAAARAAIESLSRTQDIDQARQAARDAAALNLVAGDPLLLDDTDIIFGRSAEGIGGAFDFTAGGTPTNAVRVNGRRTNGSPSGPVGLLFAGVLGQDTFLPTQTARAVNMDRDICVVIDRSGSMNWTIDTNDPPPGYEDECNGAHPSLSRWAGLRGAMDIFLATLETTDMNELVGLVSYSSDTTSCGFTLPASRIDSQMVTDYTLIRQRMINYSAVPPTGDIRVRGGTNIAAGITDGTAVVTNPATRRPFAEQTLIVMTDGNANSPGGVAAAAIATTDAATAAKAANPLLRIHTITFSDGANQPLMQQVATIGGGNHYHAPDAATLEDIFQEIALTLPVVLTE